MTEKSTFTLPSGDELSIAVASLPPLPRTIQYEDDYDEKVRTIKVAEVSDAITLHASGSVHTLRLSRYDQRIRLLMRAYLLIALQTKAPKSIVTEYALTTAIDAVDIESLAVAQPLEARRLWPSVVARLAPHACTALKALMAFFCQSRFCHWTPLHGDFVSRAFPVPGRDIYSTVRAGDCFLTVDEEARLVRWIDEAARSASSMSKSAAEIACLVTCSYQMGMRPKQLGMIRKRDFSVRFSAEDESAIVHLQFRMLKQRDPAASRLPLLRKVKREWAPLFSELWRHKVADDDDSFLFGFRSSTALATALIAQLDNILPSGGRIAYDLRHSMAQRLVDSGASHEELAAAMGHADLRTGLVYFRASANQAELVNKALGVSETYLAVARIATQRFIDPGELATLRGDQQVAGVPHGIPISGIGGCSSGQPSCQLNPVTACYGCPKFMPVRDLTLHEQVLKDFRSIVLFYKDIGHGEVASPAYLQLQRTISEVQGVIQELEGA
ncbi:MAG TPA: site-specific integrase [Burkholderiaceae bacterium]|jgi:hypothetical protein